MTVSDEGAEFDRLYVKFAERLTQGPAGLRSGDTLLNRGSSEQSEATEKRLRQLRRGVISLAEIAPVVWSKIYCTIGQVSETEAMVHISFENLCDEALSFRFWSSGWGYWECLRVIDGESEDAFACPRGISSIRIGSPPVRLDAGEIYTETRRLTRLEKEWSVGWGTLPAGRTHSLRFVYAGLPSNIFHWYAP
jgi:hypothetical protein